MTLYGLSNFVMYGERVLVRVLQRVGAPKPLLRPLHVPYPFFDTTTYSKLAYTIYIHTSTTIVYAPISFFLTFRKSSSNQKPTIVSARL